MRQALRLGRTVSPLHTDEHDQPSIDRAQRAAVRGDTGLGNALKQTDHPKFAGSGDGVAILAAIASLQRVVKIISH